MSKGLESLKTLNKNWGYFATDNYGLVRTIRKELKAFELEAAKWDEVQKER